MNFVIENSLMGRYVRMNCFFNKSKPDFRILGVDENWRSGGTTLKQQASKSEDISTINGDRAVI